MLFYMNILPRFIPGVRYRAGLRPVSVPGQDCLHGLLFFTGQFRAVLQIPDAEQAGARAGKTGPSGALAEGFHDAPGKRRIAAEALVPAAVRPQSADPFLNGQDQV